MRRSRSRFQRPASREELTIVSRVAGDVLHACVILAAPFVPFMSEAVYQGLKKRMNLSRESVHLEDWLREESLSKKDISLIADMTVCRAVCSHALRMRQDAGIKVRQPLASLTIAEHRLRERPALLALIREEVNVKQVIFGPEDALDTQITPALKAEGFIRELVRMIQEMRKGLDLAPRHKIRIAIETDTALTEIVESDRARILKDTNASMLASSHHFISHSTRESEYEGKKLIIQVAVE